jgi:hypothetical protein
MQVIEAQRAAILVSPIACISPMSGRSRRIEGRNASDQRALHGSGARRRGRRGCAETAVSRTSCRIGQDPFEPLGLGPVPIACSLVEVSDER